MFGRVFGNRRGEADIPGEGVPWIPLTEPDQLLAIREGSYKCMQVLFKHSTTCGISSMVLRMLGPKLIPLKGKADFFFLDIHNNREISDALASEYGQRHESPQLLIIRDGKLVQTASHGAIADIDPGQLLA